MLMIDAIQLCEIGMLVAFGCSWPMNIIKSHRSRTAKGKSMVFLVIVLIGYICGIAGKLISYNRTGSLMFATWFYVLNLVMVSIDLVLTIRNRRLDNTYAK